MSFDSFVEGLRVAVPAEALAQGVDPDEAFNGMISDYMVGTQDDQVALIEADRVRTDVRYHAPAKSGVMRTSGMTSEEYDDALASDPARMARVRHEYMATI